MALQIRLLGPFEVRTDAGVALRLPTRKAEALLAMLAATPGQPYNRERLAALLWPESGTQQARGSLRQTLNLLRKAIGTPCVVAAGDDLRLDPAGLHIDTLSFATAVAGADATALWSAVELYRGDFLDNLTLVSEPFEEWRTQQQEHWRERVIAAFGRLLDAQVETGAIDRAIAVGERLLALDPSSEATYRALMRAHLVQGGRGAAIRLYERCKKYLRTQLEAEPAPETEALYRKIIDGSTRHFQLPTRAHPSIAVMPFANLSGDPAQDYFARGIVEDIISELSRFRALRVIARHSSFAASQPGRSAREVAAGLGASYVLDGSVRRADDALRITAELSDVATGYNVWSDRFDAPLAAVFELQDRITRSVAGALAVRIDEDTLRKAKQRETSSLAAYDCWLRGKDSLTRKPEGVGRARDLFQHALELDPNYARAHAGLALVYYNDWNCYHWDRWAECQERAFAHARQAVELDDFDHVTHCILAQVHLYRREFDMAEKHHDRALALNPNDADVLARMAQARAQLGDAAAGVALAEAAFRLNPHHPDWYVGFTGLPYLMAGRADEAAAIMARAPDAYIDTRAFLAVAHAYLGHEAKARDHAEAFFTSYRGKIATGRPFDSADAMRWILHVTPFRLESDTRYLHEGLRKAGIGA
jgi:TolB-like protein/Tfp pilus assembly protein PilF